MTPLQKGLRSVGIDIHLTDLSGHPTEPRVHNLIAARGTAAAPITFTRYNDEKVRFEFFGGFAFKLEGAAHLIFDGFEVYGGLDRLEFEDVVREYWWNHEAPHHDVPAGKTIINILEAR